MRVIIIKTKTTLEASYPLGSSYITSYLKSNGHDVIGWDMNYENTRSLEKRVFEFKPDVICFSVINTDKKNALDVAGRLKKLIDTTIVFGGPQPTISPEEFLIDKSVDLVVRGEGEETFPRLLEAIKDKKPLEEVDGIAYKIDGKITENNDRTLIENADNIMFPDREIFPLQRYCSGMLSAKTPYTSIITSRGCAFKCSYCPASIIWRSKWRPRSPVNVCDEIEMLVEKYSIRDIHIEDDNFTVDEQRVFDFCDELIDRKLDVVWECPNGLRPETLSPELLEKMSDAGCKRIAIGIESASPQLLDELGRCSDLDAVKDAVDYSVKAGISVCGYFMIGLPDETKDMIEDKIKFSKTLNLDYAHYSVYSPIPGSALYDKGVSKVKLRQEELENIRKKAYLTFYARPKNIYRILRDMQSNPSSLKPLVNKILHCLD